MGQAVVDTDVISVLIKGDTRTELYRPYLANGDLVMSFMTLAELDRWALERGWGEKRKGAASLITAHIAVYPFNRALCAKWAEITVLAKPGLFIAGWVTCA